MGVVRRKRSSLGMIAASRVHGDVTGERRSAWDAVYRMVRRIPRGRVMTYGQVATLLESRLSPRAVGWAMHGCPRGAPWHRVVNASGGCSTERLHDMPAGLQRAMLEAEGVAFRKNGMLDLETYRWEPETSPSTSSRKLRKSNVTRRGKGSPRA